MKKNIKKLGLGIILKTFYFNSGEQDTICYL